ncbi:MAG: bile acid:sodium symporter family protein [Bacteroidales bacterium]|nr:bile acid:sodium symporter family protein [Bacteroidales bacterium]
MAADYSGKPFPMITTNIFTEIFLPITLAIITLGIGLSISVQDIRNILIQPRNISVGLFSQLLLLPIIAFTIAWVTGLQAELAVGLILIAICPGGATSNLVNFMIRGNVALSLSITVVNGLITILTIPLIAMLALHIFMHQDARIQISFIDAVGQIFMLTVLPAAIGIFIRRYKPVFAGQLENPLRYILPVLLFLVYGGVLFIERGDGAIDLPMFFHILPYALALNVLAYISGFYVPRFFGLSKRNQFTIAVEVGLQNSTLSIFVATRLLDNYTIALVSVVYGSFSFFTTWAFGYLSRKYL